MKSVMSHTFSQVPSANIQRSQFNRSHGYKTTFDAGLLVPFYVDEALPGDTFNLRLSAFARLATMLKPVMDNMRFETFFFAVPNRLLWDNWQRFNGEQDNPDDSTDFLLPHIAPGSTYPVSEGSIGDYFGLPIGVDYANLQPAALHFRAYNLIWNEWFRDQNLQDSVQVPKDDGPDSPTFYQLLRRGKRHDYFTSCLPFPQKGPAVTLPFGDTAPVTLDSANVNLLDGGVAKGFTVQHDNATFDGGITVDDKAPTVPTPFTAVLESVNGTTDLAAATAITINVMREAFQIQRLYERDARGGTRYTEIVRSHFGVTSPDARLQRPEYLGGGKTPINTTVVPQTTQSFDAASQPTPQGNLAAYGTVSSVGHGFTKSFTEHCVIIGLMCVTADLTYQNCLNRMWSRQTRFDFAWPALMHLGEQEVLNKEIFADGTATDDDVFGYQERYAEYRYKPSQITGAFRSNAAAPLDMWHLSQDFDNLPTLSAQFIEENPPIDRVIAVPSEPHFLFDSFITLKCARPMPLYSVPGSIDHF